MKKLDFTVLVPVFNTPPGHLLEMLDSIVNQSYKDQYPILIVDDGSTDELTRQVLILVHENKTTYKNVQVLFLKENKGTPTALNEGHAIIETEWVALQGSDDVSHYKRFEKQIEYIHKNPGIDVLGTNIVGFYDQDIFRNQMFTTSHKQNPPLRKGDNPYWIVNHGTVFYRQKSVMNVGGYDPKFLRAQDVDLWRRMWMAGNKFRNLEEILCLWRRKRP